MWRFRTTVPLHCLLPFPDGGGEGGGGGQQGGTQTGGTGAGESGGTGQQGGTQTGGTGVGQGAQGGQQGGAGTQTGETGSGAEDIASLPSWAQKLLTDARKEAGDARVNAKKTAADEARAGLVNDLAKALGIVKDDQLTPEQLKEQLTGVTTKHRSAVMQLAVLRAAGKAGGDSDALLDSSSFMGSIKDLDPEAETFGTQVQAAIAKAVKDNPRLGAGTPIGKGGAEFKGGAGEGAKGDSWDEVDKIVKQSRTR